MVRGEHPYVLIVDDVKQDDQDRLYEWYLQLAPDLELLYAKHDDLVLKEAAEETEKGSIRAAPGSKRMLVRCLGPWRDFPKTQPMAYNRPNFHTDARVENHQYGFHERKDRAQVSARIGKRLVVPYRGTSGDFVMLLYPYETTMPNGTKEEKQAWCDAPAGATMPQTSWSGDHSELTVRLGDQTDIFTFKELKSGRREASLQRKEKEVF